MADREEIAGARGRLDISDAEYAEAMARLREPELGAAKAYAESHWVLCAHADQDGWGAHWLAPDENCAAAGDQAAREMLAPDAVATYAAMLEATEAAGPEAGS